MKIKNPGGLQVFAGCQLTKDRNFTATFDVIPETPKNGEGNLRETQFLKLVFRKETQILYVISSPNVATGSCEHRQVRK